MQQSGFNSDVEDAIEHSGEGYTFSRRQYGPGKDKALKRLHTSRTASDRGYFAFQRKLRQHRTVSVFG